MSTVSSSSQAIRAVLLQPRGDIVRLVDDLLTACRDQGLHLDWEAGRYRLRSFAEDWHELSDVPLRKSVFRAILARLAALCNERRPGSCSPYGGQGEILFGAGPATVFRVVFTNTPTEQWLDLRLDHSTLFAPTTAGAPMLAGLLAEVPRLREVLPGWVEGHLVPALRAFPDDATDAQIDTALANLRQVLRDRADIDPWLGKIADLGIGECAGFPKAMTSDSKLPQHVPLRPNPIPNRTVIEQARQLGETLTATPATTPRRSPPPSPSRPDAK